MCDKLVLNFIHIPYIIGDRFKKLNQLNAQTCSLYL